MAQLLEEISWSDSILTSVSDPAWEAEIERRGGRVSEVDRRVTPNLWLREACLGIGTLRASAIPDRLFNIGMLVTSQENSCRYCYGANRAYMKILGYSESFISRIERDAQLARLDEKERAFIVFCRNLARSRPRPARADRDALVRLGFTPLAVNEMGLLIALGCLYNRVATMIACPPEIGFERMANGFVGTLMGVVGRLMRVVSARKRSTAAGAALDATTLASGAFGPILVPLAGLQGARVMKTALDGAFESTLLSRSSKALMFAIVARTLSCPVSEIESRKLASAEGFSDAEIETALSTLESSRLPPNEARLLSWVRATVHYQTGSIQSQTRQLVAAIGPAAALEAIGIAALANATVRLAMLIE